MHFSKSFTQKLKASLFLLVFPFAVIAQEAPIVESVRIEVQGGQQINIDAAMANIAMREGLPYDPLLVDESVRSLYNSGVYDFIEAKRETDPTGSKVRLTFLLVSKYRIQNIQFVGNTEYKVTQLEREVLSKKGALLSDLDIKRDAERLADFYEKKGYAHARVTYSIERNEQLGEALVRFEINEGARLRLSDFNFIGNAHVKADDLRDVMQTKRWWIFSWITGSGILEESLFREDLDRVIAYYKDEGFLDVAVPEAGVSFTYPSEHSMIVNITIEEGTRYYAGDVTFEGNTLYAGDKLAAILGLASGDVFSPTAVNEALENIRDYYGQSGYLETGVYAERLPDLETGHIGLNFVIKESGKFFVESLLLEGNTKTKSNVILRELALAPGDVFDLVRMKASEERLKQTLFFEEVSLSPEAVPIPNRRNLRITLKEKRTGNVQFGVGFSSVEQAVAFVELTQSNFDIFNYNSAFQGAGQKLRVRLSVGSKSNSIFLNFEEPWLFDRELAFGFDLFRTDAKYVSSVYDELRYGLELYFRKRLVELFVIRPYYRIEVIDIHNVQKDASQLILSNAGKHTISQIGAAITRETMDSLLMPTRGSRIKLIADVAGLGGTADFVRLEVQGGRWWPTFKTLNQVFSIVGRTGTITSFNNKPVPFFEAYYLGGPTNLRGYDYRDIGPKDSKGEVIGGNTYAFASTEYSFQVLQPIRLAAFYDIGFVNAGHWNWDTSQYAHDVGVGARIFVMGAPIRLDLAYPLRVQKGESRSWQFNFSFGTVF